MRTSNKRIIHTQPFGCTKSAARLAESGLTVFAAILDCQGYQEEGQDHEEISSP
jgi:hypothetical protein